MMATGIWGIGLIKQGGLLGNEAVIVEISGERRLLLIKPYDSGSDLFLPRMCSTY
jgi:hypothetical protein